MKNKRITAGHYLQQEQSKISKLGAAFICTALSGFITYFISSHGIWQQFTFLLHSIAGFYLTIIFLPYLYYHFRRTIGLRRPSMIISGILSAIVIAGVFASGIQIIFYGQQESLRWIYDSHVWSAFFLTVMIIIHFLAHPLFRSDKRKQSVQKLFITLEAATLKFSLKVIFLSFTVVLACSLLYLTLPTSYLDTAVHTPYQYPYGDHPFRPSQTETSTGTFMDIRRVGGSDRCGTCHVEIAKQWQSSMHSQAASDKTYQTNINLLAKKKGMAATRYCEGCHAPVALLSGELTKGGRLDTAGHISEGVSCMGCHGIDHIEHLKGVGSYRFTPKQDYLFADSDNIVTRKIQNFLIRIQPRQHRIDMARGVLKSAQMCATCHAQFIDKEINDWGWVKMQDEYTAWLNSPYSKQSEQSFSDGQLKRCQDCHMPLAKFNDPSMNSQGMTVSHLSLGANTAIPMYTGDTQQLLLTTKFLQSNKIRISIEKPNRPGATQSRAFINPTAATTKETPTYFYLGEKVDVNVVVSNVGVGHNFPGGTTDINEVWIDFSVMDAQNNEVYRSGKITEENNVDPDANFYRSSPIDRHGNLVWKHDLFNMVGDSYNKSIASGESDIVTYSIEIPSWVKSPLSLSATVKYRKFNNRYARWALKDENIQLPITDVARTSTIIPVRIKPEVK